jgi:hypothetical protein
VERTLSHAVAATFTAVGAVQHTPECPPDCYGPNGGELTRHRGGAEHGISDMIAPMNALIQRRFQSNVFRIRNFASTGVYSEVHPFLPDEIGALTVQAVPEPRH